MKKLEIVMSAKFKLNLIVFITIILWASAYVGIRAGLKDFTPGSLALFRFLVASACMLIIYVKAGRPHKLTWAELVQVVIIGITGFTIYHIALNYGEQTVNAAVASFIVGQSPVIITLFAMLFLNERLTIKGWFGTGISFGGIFLIGWDGSSGAHFDIGILYVLLATFSSCAFTILQKPLLKKIHPINCISYAIWAGTACMLVFLPDLWHEVPKASAGGIFAAVYIGIFPAAIAYLLWSYALEKLPASKLSSTLYIAPLFTMIISWLVLDEIPTLIAAAGGIVALLGAYMVHSGVRQAT
jgi:drug/metabolite transporter (DMT)-like permease